MSFGAASPILRQPGGNAAKNKANVRRIRIVSCLILPERAFTRPAARSTVRIPMGYGDREPVETLDFLSKIEPQRSKGAGG